MTRAYVAAPFAEFMRARAAMARLRSAGILITHDWTQFADLYPADDAPPAERVKHARGDLCGVAEASLVLVLTPEDRSLGAGLWVEMGAALAMLIPVVVAGPQRDRNVFCDLAKLRAETDEQALEWIIAGHRLTP